MIELVPSVSVLAAGFLHGLGTDHLTATAAMVGLRPRDLRRAALVGIQFGIGHMGAVVLLGLSALLLGFNFSERFERFSYAAGGLVLVALGLSTLVQVVTGKVHLHPHSHTVQTRRHHSVRHLHLHSHPHDHFHESWRGEAAHPHTLVERPAPAAVRWRAGRGSGLLALVVGAAFALSGIRSYLVVIPVALSSRYPIEAVYYVALFGLGIVTSMGGFGMALGTVYRKGIRSEALVRNLTGGIATASIVFGLVLVIEQFRA
ncbi:MAG: hypothetical protein HYY08_00730 [Firmicutes bacterium]|nr:hypothetical protein [Bacillota bacterium]